MKKIFILFVAILASCTSPEIVEEKPTVKTCYNIVEYHDGDIDWIMIMVNGSYEKYQVPRIQDYYRAQICDLSNLKKL
jgi:hypothetical protein